MTSLNSTNRLGGARAQLAVKAPVQAATTGQITLSGEQTVDGVALVAGNRCFVKDQSDTTQLGIFDVKVGAWTRSADFDGSDDVTKGTRIFVAPGGTVNGNTEWVVATSGTIVPGTTALSFNRFTAAAGADAGVMWTYDSSTSMADPGTGKLRLNSATLSAVTAMAISDLTALSGNPDLSSWVLSWDDSSSEIRGQIILRRSGASENLAIYNITSASTDNSGWTQLVLAHVASHGALSGDTLLFFAPANRSVSGTFSRYYPANQWRPRLTAGCAALAGVELGTQLIYQETLDFDQTTDEGAEISIVMPGEWDSGTITLTPYWTASSGTGDVVWAFQARAYSDNNGYNGALSSAVTSIDTKGTSGALFIAPTTSAITISNVSGTTQMIVIRITRDADNAADTLNADAKLVGVRLNYTAA